MAKWFDAILADQLADPAIRSEWERTALARAVAISVIRYRAVQGLSQRQLAERLGWRQAQVARLELGEHTPTLDTLIHLSQALGLEFLVDVRPVKHTGPRWVTPEAEQAETVEAVVTPDGAQLLVAAG